MFQKIRPGKPGRIRQSFLSFAKLFCQQLNALFSYGRRPSPGVSHRISCRNPSGHRDASRSDLPQFPFCQGARCSALYDGNDPDGTGRSQNDFLLFPRVLIEILRRQDRRIHRCALIRIRARLSEVVIVVLRKNAILKENDRFH